MLRILYWLRSLIISLTSERDSRIVGATNNCLPNLRSGWQQVTRLAAELKEIVLDFSHPLFHSKIVIFENRYVILHSILR